LTEEPYYFKAVTVPDLDAKEKEKLKKGELTDAEKAELQKRFKIGK
jgi:hypothetical protein